jgi:cellulose synthase/poly-beta-1,6-N-acetylglucosamine synthase-like glycosyltransferase
MIGNAQPYWFGIDADTRLDKHCLEHLYTELVADESLGGVMARYTFDQKLGAQKGLLGSLLVFAQRLEFTGWTDDLLHRQRKTYVLGGQASLFRTSVLAEVAEQDDRESPWTTATLVEDMELSWQIEQAGYRALVSKDARAYAGPMTALRGLWGQRGKWDYGLSKLLWDRRHLKGDPITAYPWRLQAKMALDFVQRAMFVVLITAAAVLDAMTWHWFWIIPPIWAALLNLRLAANLPHRRARDLVLAGTLIIPELYLLIRLASWFRCWLKVLRHRDFDGWSAQYSAERKALGK